MQEILRSPEDNESPNVELDESPTEEEEDIEDEEENDDEEEEEDNEEDNGDKDDEKERMESVVGDLTRVSLKEVTSKHPTFFKDFPTLKHAFFREQQFTELFPTVEDAKTAAEAQTAYEQIKNTVLEGDANTFINELGTENKESVNKFAHNFLSSVKDYDQNLYFDILAPQVQGFIKNVYSHGKKENDQNIINAAKIVHKILFQGDYNDVEKDYAPPRSNGNTSSRSDVDKDRERYFAEKYNNLYNEVSQICYSNLEAEIDKGLSDLGKDKAGLKKLIAKEIKDKVLQQMNKDSVHMNRMKNLWLREKGTGFSGKLKESFKATFMAKAKTLIGKARMEARREALGRESNNGEGKEANRFSSGKMSSGKGKPMTPERQRTEKLTTRQIFD